MDVTCEFNMIFFLQNFNIRILFGVYIICNYVKTSIAAMLGVNEVIGTGRYLGMPSMIGRNKKAIFSYLKDRM
jgi:hypothetical protein